MVKLHVEKLDKEIDDVSYAHPGDAGFDLRASHDAVIKAGEKEIIKTGIKIAIPNNHTALIWPRSGLAVKNDLHVMAGVIDVGYRGEVGVVLKNLGKTDFKVEKNMRIAQMLIQPVATAEIVHVDKLDDDTKRSTGGFGSSGLE